MAKTIKVSPVVIDGEEYKIKGIDLPKKTKIMNELIATDGTPSYDLFVKILQIVGFKDDDILMFDIQTTTQIGNAVITACNTKKKKKSN